MYVFKFLIIIILIHLFLIIFTKLCIFKYIQFKMNLLCIESNTILFSNIIFSSYWEFHIKSKKNKNLFSIILPQEFFNFLLLGVFFFLVHQGFSSFPFLSFSYIYLYILNFHCKVFLYFFMNLFIYLKLSKRFSSKSH